MYSFKNDYCEGAHPNILQALIDTNFIQETGYGKDQYSLKAVKLIKRHIGQEDVDVHFIPGGTQTNLIAISSFLRPHEAVISADSGHINVHETGAIEGTGHKVLTMNTNDGKLTPKQIQNILNIHTDEHMVKPKLVYISNSTELGTIYNKEELVALRAICKENDLLFYMDGARLGSALCSNDNDLTLNDLPDLFDAFYIGGTKNGALIGEALVICNDSLKKDFRYYIKQKGALLAKGRLLGIQFIELFKDNLFFELAEHANRMAAKIQKGLKEVNVAFLTESPTNQIFPILTNEQIEALKRNYDFELWKRVDESHTAIRFVTSWATKEEAVDQLIKDVKNLI
jgi:threonine aldolase